MRTYHEHFKTANWENLSPIDQKRHSLVRCLMCARDPEFALKTVNNKYVNYVKANNIRPPEKEPERVEYIIQHPVQQPTPQLNPMTTDDIPSHLKRKIIQDYKTEEAKVFREGDFDRVYATNISMAQYREQRMLQSSEYRENPAKGHVGSLDLYIFDENIVRRKLQQTADENKDLGDRLHRKWAELAREAGLRRRNQTNEKTIPNAGQVGINKFGLGINFLRHKFDCILFSRLF